MRESKRIRKNLMVTLLIVSISIFLFTGLASTNQWAIKFEWGSLGEGPSIQQTTDGGYIVGGNTEYFGSGYDDFWVLKLNSDGTIAWQKTYGGSSTDRVTSVQQTVEGGYIVAGYTTSFGMGSGDFWILKLNSDGTIVWQKTYGGSSSDLAFSIQQTIDGGYIVAGGSGNFWVLKLNADGTISWQKRYGGRTSASAYSVQQTVDSGYIVVGNICETDPFGNCTGIFDMWVLKLNSDSTIAWQKRYGGSTSDHASSVQQTVDGGYIVAGATASFGAGNYDFWVLKLNSDGTILWQKTYGGSGDDKAHSIHQTVDGGYILAGTTYSLSGSSQDMVILKLTTDGTVAWQKTYNGGSSVNWLSSIQETTDGNYVLAGLTEVCPYGYSDLIIMKIDANGEIPGCNIMGSFDADVTDTSAIITDTSVVPQDSSVVPSDTNVLPQDTAGARDVICGVSPNISVSPMSHNFGSVYIGSTSIPQTFVISNTGQADLNIGAIGTNNFEFIIENDSCSGHSIVPLATCTLDVVFSPTSSGSKSSTLSIPSNDPDTPTAGIQLSGTGINVTLTLLSPNGGEIIPSGSTYTIRWIAPQEAVKFTLTYSKDNGTTWNLIASNVTGTSYNWQVPIPFDNKKQCLVKVKAFNSLGVQIGKDKSDSVFTIEVVKLTSPDGGETLTSGTTHTIRWTTNATKNPVASVKLTYTTNGGSTWTLIDTTTGNTGSYDWTVPNVSSSSCKVKVVLKDTTGTVVGKDASDGFFEIQ